MKQLPVVGTRVVYVVRGIHDDPTLQLGDRGTVAAVSEGRPYPVTVRFDREREDIAIVDFLDPEQLDQAH